ncbi:MAG: MgtC/SapB family protein [Gammaproteobacteria bacterium]|nr:MgtC/SapB family protein [Gammaproteobacteria bacterium]
MDDITLALRFGAALGLGVLLGLERERIKGPEKGFAGVRTIGLIALAGAMSAYFEQVIGLPWLGLAVFVAVASLVTVSYAVTAARGDVGITTEVTALIAFLLGSLCLRGYVPLAASLAVATALVLALKQWLHHLAQRIEGADVEATLQFAIVTLIILPLVPDQNFGPEPLDVLNPYKVWLMVVLISGLNFASYILVKMVGPEHGIGVTGLLGGLVSSTAVTLGFAQRSRMQPAQSGALALGILLAWSVMFVRVIIMVAIISRPTAARLGVVMGALALASLAMCWALWRRRKATETATVPAGDNPFELRQAIQFGLLFGVVTMVARAAQVYLGDAGLYLAGAVAGLTDVDAIALSMANLGASTPASIAPAAATIVIAAGSNTLVKAGIVAFTGAAELRRLILMATGVLLAVGGVLLVLQ